MSIKAIAYTLSLVQEENFKCQAKALKNKLGLEEQIEEEKYFKNVN